MNIVLTAKIAEPLLTYAWMAACSLATIAGCLAVLVAVVLWQQWRDL